MTNLVEIVNLESALLPVLESFLEPYLITIVIGLGVLWGLTFWKRGG